MREALEKEDKEKAASKDKAATVPKAGGEGIGKNGKSGRSNSEAATPGEETARAWSSSSAYVIPEEPPTVVELVGWYVYSFCSYFVTHLLLPVLFPAIVTQVAFPNSDFTPDPNYTVKGSTCSVHLMSM